MSGDVTLPQTEDPFDDNLGYGAAIYVVSTQPHHRITWAILTGIIEGLWNHLIEEDNYFVGLDEFILDWYLYRMRFLLRERKFSITLFFLFSRYS